MATFENLEYNNNLMRESELNIQTNTPETGNGGFVATVPVKNSLAMDDVWITNSLRSQNWKSKTQGFYIDGASGYAEFASGRFRGDLSVSGTITGVTIISSHFTSGTITLDDSTIGSLGSLNWTGGNSIFEDPSNYMVFDTVGDKFYFYYSHTHLAALFQRGSQVEFYEGVHCEGSFNVDAGYIGTTMQPSAARIYGPLKLAGVISNVPINTEYLQSDNTSMFYHSSTKHVFDAAVQVGSYTTTNRDLMTPANGMIIYNTTLNKFQFRENGAWWTLNP
jgi:hypothetical protein